MVNHHRKEFINGLEKNIKTFGELEVWLADVRSVESVGSRIAARYQALDVASWWPFPWLDMVVVSAGVTLLFAAPYAAVVGVEGWHNGMCRTGNGVPWKVCE